MYSNRFANNSIIVDNVKAFLSQKAQKEESRDLAAGEDRHGRKPEDRDDSNLSHCPERCLNP